MDKCFKYGFSLQCFNEVEITRYIPPSHTPIMVQQGI